LTPRLGTPISARLSPPFQRESIVVEVNSATKSQIDDLMAQGHEVGINGHIAVGPVDYNRNYYAPGQPVWNWHYVSIDSLRDFTLAPYDTAEVWPPRDSFPSDIAKDPAAWIHAYGDVYYPKGMSIWKEIDPSKSDAVANVSNRAMTGAGEKTAITGFIVTGGVPRSVVLRAIGPSLASAGVQQAATNPRLDLFSSTGRKLLSNTDWKNDNRAAELAQNYSSLAPTNDKEAALLVTLLPGSYSVQVTNEDGTEGVVLVEVYDVDSVK
jgi:hypothetical protein